MSATEDLFAEFEVNQSNGSADLYARFRIYPIFSGTPRVIFAKFFVGSDGSQDLYAKFTTQAVQNLKAEFVVRQSGYANLFMEMRIYVFFGEGWADKKAVFLVTRPGAEDLLAELTVRQNGSADLKSVFTVRHSASTELFSEGIIRHSDYEDLLTESIIRHTATQDLAAQVIIRHSASIDLFFKMVIIPAVNLKGVFTVRHTTSENLKGFLYVRHPFWMWTTRRYINGVVDTVEDLIGDAKLEYVIEGVMEDIQGFLTANQIEYDNWTDITLVPVLIRRATTYGTVAALYARHSRTFRSRVIPTVAPVTVTTIGDDERAMMYWTKKLDTALANYLSSVSSPIFWVSTQDEEPLFTMGDIPLSEWNPADDLEEWHTWLNQRSY